VSSPHGYIEKLAEMAKDTAPFVAVTLVDVVGSTPQDAGSKMLVSSCGLEFGTVGGGKIEAKAITLAQEMLRDPKSSPNALVRWNLQTDVGMTCGGTVQLFLESFNRNRWQVVVFGAGHVAQAVTELLLTLDCRVTCYDPRPEWVEQLSQSPHLQAVCEPDLPSRVAEIPDEAFVICMTMGHQTDRPILEKVFREGRHFSYLGVIGSRAKRKVLLRELVDSGLPRADVEAFHCPIGLDIGSNQPGEIAISVVAQLIGERDRLWKENCAKTAETE
jgi:xanthine dehydrogenase accessory factor